MLSLAAVIGRTFGLPLLERLVPRDELMHALTELQRLDLIVEKRRRPNPEYRFRHGLVQEVAYASLVDSKRRKLHKRVGEALEEIYKESPEEAYGLLARHFAEADEPEKAVDYLLKAGDAARAVYADKEALEHYRKARAFLARVGDERRARDTLFKMALAYHLAFDFESAEEMYDEAFCCRVRRGPAAAERPSRLETASSRPSELAPGDVYTTEAGYFSELLFRGLLMVDSELNVVPAMADNFRVSSDGLTYLFRIREGASWSDGEPLTADDYAYAWRRMREQETRDRVPDGGRRDRRGARRPDARGPRSASRGATSPTSSARRGRSRGRATSARRSATTGRKPENLVGNGPFVLVEYDDDHALLRANPHWSGAHGNVGEIHFSFYPKGAKMVEEWQEGRFDLLHVYDPVSEEEPRHARRRRPGARSPVHRVLRRPVAVLEPARAQGVLARGRPRGARCPLPALGPRPRGEPRRRDPAGDAGPLPPGRAEYDLERARALLAEAGYPGGKGLPEINLVVPHWLQPVEPIAELWRPIGAHVKVVPNRGHVDCEFIAGAHMWWSGWTADYPDPDGFFRGFLTRATGPSTATTTSSSSSSAAARCATRASACASTTRSTTTGWASTGRSFRSPTRAPSSSAAPGWRACGRARSPCPPGHRRGRGPLRVGNSGRRRSRSGSGRGVDSPGLLSTPVDMTSRCLVR